MPHSPFFAFSVEDFLSVFAEFAEKPEYTIRNAGLRAMLHISGDAFGVPMVGEQRAYAQFLMTAHLLKLDEMDDSNGNDGTPDMAGTPFKATVGTVSIEATKQNSSTTDDWNYWLNMTKYGRELLAYLETRALGIFLNTPNDSVRDLL